MKWVMPFVRRKMGLESWMKRCECLDHRAFVTDVREDYDEVTGVLIGDATGNNRVFLQIHNRGSLAVAPADVRTLLLLARPDGAGNPPNLPPGWDARLQSADATAWTGASWVFADPGSPYRSPVIPLTAREPQVVEWVVDFQARGFAAGDTVTLKATLKPSAPAGTVVHGTLYVETYTPAFAERTGSVLAGIPYAYTVG